MEKSEVEFHPLPINILRLQYFSHYFDLTEMAMFNWFVVKGKAFEYRQFYYSYRRISDETHIKEDRLKTIVKRFVKEGIVSIEVRGLPRTSYFTVNYSRVLELVPDIFVLQFAENRKLIAYFSQLSAENSKHKGKYNKESKKDKRKVEYSVESPETIPAESNYYNGQGMNNTAGQNSSNSGSAVEEKRSEENARLDENETDLNMVIRDLNKVYLKRVELYNQECGERKKTPIGEMAFNRKSKLLLLDLMEGLDDWEDIDHSFTAYIDAVLRRQINVDKIIPYFLFQDDDYEFPAFQHYLDRFATKYSLVENH